MIRRGKSWILLILTVFIAVGFLFALQNSAIAKEEKVTSTNTTLKHKVDSNGKPYITYDNQNFYIQNDQNTDETFVDIKGQRFKVEGNLSVKLSPTDIQKINAQAAPNLPNQEELKKKLKWEFFGKQKGDENPNLTTYLRDLYQWALIVGAGLAIIMIMWAGYTYITTAGDPEGIRAAKDYLWGALLGLGLLILTWAIANTLFINTGTTTTTTPPPTMTTSK